MGCRKCAVSDRSYVPNESSHTENDFRYFEDSNSGTDCSFLDTSSHSDESENHSITIQNA